MMTAIWQNLNRRRTAALAGLILLALAALAVSRDEIGMSGNEATRLATVQALTEQGTFAIERTHFRTVDFVRRNGHIYSDKPPMPALLGAAFWSVPQKLFGWNFQSNYHLALYVIHLVLFGGTNLLLFWLFFGELRRTSRLSNRMILGWGLALTLGSWCFSYSVVFNNHTITALALFAGFIALQNRERGGGYESAGWAGIFAGLAFTFEYPSGFLFGTAGLIAFAARRDWRGMAAYCAGGLLPVGISVLASRIGYGTAIPLYLGQGGTFQGGFHQKSWPGYFFDILLGARGVFSHQPVLLLLIPALWLNRRWQKSPAEIAMLCATAGLVLFYGAATNEYGGWAYGFRYLIPVLPFWFLWTARGFGEARIFHRWRVPVGVLAAAGVIAAWVGAYMPFCVAYEGMSRPPTPLNEIRSPFLGNLFCISYEYAPEGAWTQWFFQRYGEPVSWHFLQTSYVSQKKANLLREIFVRSRRGQKPPDQ